MYWNVPHIERIHIFKVQELFSETFVRVIFRSLYEHTHTHMCAYTYTHTHTYLTLHITYISGLWLQCEESLLQLHGVPIVHISVSTCANVHMFSVPVYNVFFLMFLLQVKPKDFETLKYMQMKLQSHRKYVFSTLLM